ncbi:hypothetical protein Nepgr_017395 [Nepenthes gracilis]|uniref:Uncharacterized protein n=1 Tax=Nepenthes gracilis TaxID=150966 RepID=A0AAD3XT20_NEPGR|nr:hypothetical protein Nepgr_017395 [Nepenthes gracilis]
MVQFAVDLLLYSGSWRCRMAAHVLNIAAVGQCTVLVVSRSVLSLIQLNPAESRVIELKTFMLETLCVFKNNKALDPDVRGLWWLSGDVNSVSQLLVD